MKKEKKMNFKVSQVEWLEFDEGSHTYYYKIDNKSETRKRIPLSVTGIVNAVYPFEGDAIAGKIATDYLVSGEQPKDKILCKTFTSTVFSMATSIHDKIAILTKTVKDHWGKSSVFGTAVHSYLEDYVASGGTKMPPEDVDLKTKISFDAMLKYFAEEKKFGYEPIPMTELKICMPYARTKFHTKTHNHGKRECEQECCGIAGSVDLILINKDTGKCKICDYKTVKEKHGNFFENTKKKWQLQLGLYHRMIKYSQPLLKMYDPVSFVIFQIHPDCQAKHVFGVSECEIVVNEALQDNVFWVDGWSKLSTATGLFIDEHAECNPREEPECDILVKNNP